jgi:hypothetical protein
MTEFSCQPAKLPVAMPSYREAGKLGEGQANDGEQHTALHPAADSVLTTNHD